MYEIPSGTFHKDSRVMLQFRISDDAAGNYPSVEVYLPTSGGNLFARCAGSRRNSKTALQTITSGVGTPAHHMSFIGDRSITSTDGRRLRRDQPSRATYQTATGCNVISPSSLPTVTRIVSADLQRRRLRRGSQLIDENDYRFGDTDRTYEFANFRALSPTAPNLHITNDGLVPASPPVIHKEQLRRQRRAIYPAERTYICQPSGF